MRSQKEYQGRTYMKAVSMAEEERERERERPWNEEEEDQWGCSVNIEKEGKNDTR